MTSDLDPQIKSLQAVNEVLKDYSQSQTVFIKQLQRAFIIVFICFSLIICAMITGFFWYESQFEAQTVETTTTTLSTEGENAEINNVTNGDMYNDSSVHDEN